MQLFFCFGPPKSGTTYLQRILNEHPHVSCPSEQHSSFLHRGLQQLFSDYNRGVAITDSRTGAQGPFQIDDGLLEQIFADCIRKIARAAAREKPVFGLHDNEILRNLELFTRLFPDAKFIAIFRHPIPRAISAWAHNLRLADEEQNEQHRRLTESYGGYDGWIKQLAKDFQHSVDQYRNLVAEQPNCMHVTYERLIHEASDELPRLFEFLEVDCDDQLFSLIRESTSLTRLRATSPRPHFFRAAATKPMDASISEEVMAEVESTAAAGLEYLGYPQVHQASGRQDR